jgi:hypothetical protein
MDHTAFIEQLKALAASEDILAVSKEVNELRIKFDDYVLEEERKQQVAQLEAKDKGEEFEAEEIDFGKEAFYEVYDEYRKKRKEANDAIRAVEETNLNAKKALIKKLQEVITNEENIGAAFGALKEVQEKWKEVGDIPRNKRSDIQSEYSKLMEAFFYNINIYKQLKEHDFHRNKQMKEKVIGELKELSKTESIKEVESQLKLLQNQWDEIGPVPNEEWETIKDAYWTEVRSSYERINRFYEDRRSKQLENIEKKKALIERVKNIASDIEGLDSVKGWDSKTKKVLEIQKEWKTIGFGPKKENDEVWKEFRAICDQFFGAKKGFFEKAQVKFDAVAEKKAALIDKAVALKDSTDWKETSKQLIHLQKQWKQLGHSGKRHEQKLWRKFRGACDDFFNAKQKHLADQDKAFEDNLKSKEALIKEISKTKLPADKKEALTVLKDLSAKFNEIGMVPRASKDKIYSSFKEAMDKHYGSIKLEGKEKEETLFKAKLDTMQASPDSFRKFQDLKSGMRKDIDKLNKEIVQLENNLGFFANSKGANELKKDVEKKIKRAQDQIDGIKAKMKLIPNE